MMRINRRKKAPLPQTRMAADEKLIVKYIVNQLESVYRDTSGAPVYARNMDQVMHDIFGVKKFCKTLKKARTNEPLMIQLMKRLDTNVLWEITRSKEHYRLLCYLVALDNYIVRKGRKFNKYADMEMSERPTRKMRAIQKDIKKSRKMYKTCIKTLRDIFDISRSDPDSSNAILDGLESWLDRYDGDDGDIFYGLDSYGYDSDTLESMDEYVASMRNGRNKRKHGALGIFDESQKDIFDDMGGGYADFVDEDDDDDEDDGVRLSNADLARLAQMMQAFSNGGAPVQRPIRTGPSMPRSATVMPPNDQMVPAGSGMSPELAAVLATITNGFGEINKTMSVMLDYMTDDGGDQYEEDGPADIDGYGWSAGGSPEHPAGAPRDIADMIAMSNPPAGAETAPEGDEPIPNRRPVAGPPVPGDGENPET